MTVPRRSATAAVVVAAPMSMPSTKPGPRVELEAPGRAALARAAGGWSSSRASSSRIQPRRIRSSQTAITEARVSPVRAISSVPVATSVARMKPSTDWAFTRRSSWGVAAAAVRHQILTSP